MTGSVFKRPWLCRRIEQEDGGRLPSLSRSDHGSRYYRVELPSDPDGARRSVRKGGYPTKRDAQRALVDLLDRVDKRTHVEPAKGNGVRLPGPVSAHVRRLARVVAETVAERWWRRSIWRSDLCAKVTHGRGRGSVASRS